MKKRQYRLKFAGGSLDGHAEVVDSFGQYHVKHVLRADGSTGYERYRWDEVNELPDVVELTGRFVGIFDEW